MHSEKYLYLKLATIMLGPFFLAICFFVIEVYLLSETQINFLVHITRPLFELTSINAAYVQTRDPKILYFWIFWIFALPTFIGLVVLGALRFGVRKSVYAGISRGAVVGGTLIISLLLFALFCHPSFYFPLGRDTIFAPTFGGLFAYAFVFEAICFLGIVPALKILAALFDR